MALRAGIAGETGRISAALGIVFLLLGGCANPGPPRPPSLHLPEPVADLSAERVGDEVHLRWTTSDKTTDGLAIRDAMTAQLCRQAGTSPCQPVQSLAAKPGASEVADLLPQALLADPQGLLVYRVTLLNSHQHGAEPSAPAFAAAGAAPPTIVGLRVEPSARGALLQWKAEDAGDSIELDRLRAGAASARPSGPLQPAQEPVETRFRATRPGAEPFHLDAGGTLDATARSGETYSYTAQRVRRVALGGHDLEIRSVPSALATLVMRDTFPPHPPAGLAAVLAPGAAGAPVVDLSWRPDTESDLAGYLVYRQELGVDGSAVGAPARLTGKPITEPGYRDAAPLADHVYRYTVTAVDGSGNESRAGEAVQQEIRLP
ncbi:MAG TPA: hypothetical protein VGC07_02810 [Granulicella sp.]